MASTSRVEIQRLTYPAISTALIAAGDGGLKPPLAEVRIGRSQTAFLSFGCL
jgi:hypothetical protein